MQVIHVMNLNHNHLQNLGVSCKELDELVEVARETSLGAKLTGAGGGGASSSSNAGSEGGSGIVIIRYKT